MIIDFHTHAFPDKVAEKAVKKLIYGGAVKSTFDWTVSGLLKSMDYSGIDKSVVLNIATKPSQTENIIKWCKEIKSERLIPFASIHPENDNFADLVRKIKDAGLLGIKLHPMYQNFYLDDERMFLLYEEIEKNNLILLLHAGLDLAFPDDKRASIGRLKKLVRKFPGMKIVAAHTGGWRRWDEVLLELAGENLYFDTSMTLDYIKDEKKFLEILGKHPSDKVLFGTDAPGGNQKLEAAKIENLDIPDVLKKKILFANAEKLLWGMA